MGKYPIVEDGVQFNREHKHYYLFRIANELAEANRLKRYELSSGLVKGSIPKDLEDQA